MNSAESSNLSQKAIYEKEKSETKTESTLDQDAVEEGNAMSCWAK